MTQAIALLMTAMQLLMAVQSQPNLTPAFKDNATQIANYAITYAQAEIANAQAQPNAPVVPDAILPIISQPITLGATAAPMPPEVTKDITFVVESYMQNANGPYVNLFVYYTENGKEKEGTEITISADDEGTFNYTTLPTGPNGFRSGKPAAFFQYSPSAEGTRTLTATANGVTKTFEVRGR